MEIYKSNSIPKLNNQNACQMKHCPEKPWHFLLSTKYKLTFFYRKNRCLTPTPRQLLCSALIQPDFDCAYSARYPNLTKKLKNRIQTPQNKSIRFCRHLDKMTHISDKEFKTLNWLPVTETINQCINSIVFKYVNDQCPNYLNGVFQTAPENSIQTRGSFLKLKCPFRKTNSG